MSIPFKRANLVGPLLVALAISTQISWRVFAGPLSACDLHDEAKTVSPNGTWEAHWETEGCSGLLLTTTFHAKVGLLKVGSPRDKQVPVFESDSSDLIKMTWVSNSTLNLEILSETTVSRSERHIGNILILYSISPSLKKELGKLVKSLKQQDASDQFKSLSPADQKASNEAARAYLLSIDKFIHWVNDFAEPSDRVGAPH